MKITEEIREELERVRLADPEGLLRPEAVVEAGRPKGTPLHSVLKWDDSRGAAAVGRLKLAYELIMNVRVTYERDSGKKETARMYVSLPSDRGVGNGYRSMTEVMSDEDRRQELLTGALRDMESFRRRYHRIKDLIAVWPAIEEFLSAGSTG